MGACAAGAAERRGEAVWGAAARARAARVGRMQREQYSNGV